MFYFQMHIITLLLLWCVCDEGPGLILKCHIRGIKTYCFKILSKYKGIFKGGLTHVALRTFTSVISIAKYITDLQE